MGFQLSSLSCIRLSPKFVVALAPLLIGCFSLQPVERLAPKPGAEVAVDLNDAGRSALASTLGPQVSQVHGHLVRHEGTDDVLALTSTEFVHGGEKQWSGDTLRVRSDYASRYYESRVSTKRSLVVGGLVVGALAVMSSQVLGTTPIPDATGGVEQPGDKLRTRPRAALRFSASSNSARRAVRLVLPFLTRP
jgi:hypothetical protein